MKISKNVFFGTCFLAGFCGCSRYEPEPCKCVPPVVHNYDAGAARDLAQTDDLAARPDVFAFDNALSSDMTVLFDDAISARDVQDSVPDQIVDSYVADKATFNPLPGHYTVKHDPAFPGSEDSVRPLNESGFTVVVDSLGGFSFTHTPAGWARFTIQVINGGFYYQNGEGFDRCGGIHCPTDGFGIRGEFISPTEARGRYERMERCCGDENGRFIATLDSLMDSGVAIEVGSISEAGAIDR